MTNNDFNKIIEGSINKIRSLLLNKGKEYASEEDRLSNFKQLSFLQKVIPEKTLLNLTSKHILSLFNKVDFLNSIQYIEKLNNPKSFVHLNEKELQKYEEYIFDIIVYMLLLKGLLNERRYVDLCSKRKK